MSYGPAVFQMLLPDGGMRLQRASKAKLIFRGFFLFVCFFFTKNRGLTATTMRTSDILMGRSKGM